MERTSTLVPFISKGEEGTILIVDYRERYSATVQELKKLGADLEFRNLKVGDYLISEDVAIKRKTIEDFEFHHRQEAFRASKGP